MIKRLIFDVDNTLITGVNFQKSIEQTLKQMEIFSDENIQKFLYAIKTYEENYNQYTKNDYINYFSKILGLKLPENFLDIFFDNLKNCIPTNNEDIKNTISQLSQKYDLVLLTNYFSISQLNRLKSMNISQYFSECHGETNCKPNPKAYIEACGPYQPEECVMIGDDLFLDIECAHNLGLHTIFINTKNKTEYTTPKETIVLNSVIDLNEEIIKKLNLSHSK